VVVALFLGMSVSAEEIFKDRRILARESFLNLSKFSYINSKIALLFGLSATQAFLFVAVGNFILEIDGMTWYYWSMLFSVSCFANMVGLNISASLNSIISIYILIPFILVPQLLLGGAMISFDDLHKSMTNRKNVPLVGDIMASRWAYEALCVAQFKQNRFESLFFDVEQKLSHSSYVNSFLIPRLEIINENLNAQLKNEGKNDNFESRIGLLRNEVAKLHSVHGFEKYNELDAISNNNYSESASKALEAYLEKAKHYYRNEYNTVIYQKDTIYQELVNTIGRDQLLDIQKGNSNKNIASLVQNREELDKILEINGELVQKKDPIYMIPESNFGRAHFFSPVKKIAGVQFDTFYFNLTIVWLMSLFLYFALYYDLLKRIMNLFGFQPKKFKKVI
jgi:hypothetical protein